VIEQLRAVLTTYSRRTAFQVLAAAVLPLLLVSYRMSFASRPESTGVGYLILSGPFALIYFLFLGHHMKLQLASSRLKLVPQYVFAHLAAASLLTFVVAAISGIFAVRYANAISQLGHVTPTGEMLSILGILWAISLLSFSAGYFFGPVFFWGLVMAVQLSISNGFPTRLISGLEPWASIALIVLDAALTLTLLKRMLHLDESMFEYRNKEETRESRRYWSSNFSEGTLVRRLFGRGGDYYLDRITPSYPDSFLQQVRHFEQTSATTEWSLVSSALLIVVVLWAANLMSGAAETPYVSFFTLIPTITVFMGLVPAGKRSLQSIFMLPLDRNMIVSGYGCALFVVILKNWLSYAFAGLIVAWMPAPGRFHSIPSVTPWITSLAGQLPLFGFFSLVAGRAKGVLIGLAVLAAFLVGLGSEFFPRLFPAAETVAGLLLVWLSYRRWCNAEIID
jgi:hypothetical protein